MSAFRVVHDAVGQDILKWLGSMLIHSRNWFHKSRTEPLDHITIIMQTTDQHLYGVGQMSHIIYDKQRETISSIKVFEHEEPYRW